MLEHFVTLGVVCFIFVVFTVQVVLESKKLLLYFHIKS